MSDFHRLALKHADTILGTPVSAINQTIVGGGPNCKQSCAPLCDSTCQWKSTLAGAGGTASADAPPLEFLCNDALIQASVSLGARPYSLAPRSCKVIDGSTGAELWDSHSPAAADAAAPFVAIPSLAPGKLVWATWPTDEGKPGGKHTGDWYRARFALPSELGAVGASASVNMSGFASGNVFVNGHNLGYFNLAAGNCSKCSKGGFGCWPDGDYVPGGCGRPTQDMYHVPPEWLNAGRNNELLVWNAAPGTGTPSASVAGGSAGAPLAWAKQNGMLPPNVTAPAQASVVMRTIGK